MNKLNPFKWFVLQNFPFIEADFDALTNYELMCKVVEYLNANITKTNELGEQVEILTNWFNNLDVQDEIDNKLDAMAQDGTLAKIIEDYATIPELTDRVSQLESDVSDIEDTLNEKEKILLISDSYGAMSNDTWIEKIITLYGNKVDCLKIALGGAGFYTISPYGYNFLTYLQHLESEITDKNRVKKIVVGGGYNDRNNSPSDNLTAITSFCNYCKTTYPNAKIYIACLGFNKTLTSDGNTARERIRNNVIPAYSGNVYVENDPIYIQNSENILKNDALISDDGVHPSNLGHEYIAKKLYAYLESGTPITNKTSVKSANLTYNGVNYPIMYRKDENRALVQSSNALIMSSFPANTNFVSGGIVDGTTANFIGDIDATDLYPSGTFQQLYETTCSITCSEGTFRNIPCVVWLQYNRKLKVHFTLRTEGGQLQTFTNVSAFSLNNFLHMNLET